MSGVSFDGKHSLRDLGLILISKTISPPEPQTMRIEVPMKNGALDFTEALTGDVRYKDRKITMTFSYIDQSLSTITSKFSEIQNLLHGKRMKVIFDDDQAFYYDARLSVTDTTQNKSTGQVIIEGEADPYKHDIEASDEEWIWDTFDFENGIVNECKDVMVNGQKDVFAIVREAATYPIMITDAPMTVSFEGESFDLPAGITKAYEIVLKKGENHLTFQGTGTVSIHYVGGSL